MVSSIQGSNIPDMNAIREQMQKMQKFQQGKINISKDDLSNIQSDMKSKGIEAPDQF
ncbi:MAG: hypothetical protein WCK67_06005 [bacterium]